MALMYTDSSGILQGVLHDISFDADIGEENDFLLTVPKTHYSLLGVGCRVFDSENPSFGGLIDGIEVDTSSDTVSFTGVTWFGLLSQKVISPLSGQAYRTMSGSTVYIMGKLIDDLNFGDFFYVPDYDPETQGDGSSYTFKRYVTLLDGLTDLLQSRERVLNAEYNASRKKVKLTARTPENRLLARGFIQSPFNYKITRPLRPVNHIIALGRGELTNRTVVHLYLQSDGSIGTTQQFFGTEEVTYIYDNSAAETRDELTRLANKKFEELSRTAIEISVATNTNYYIGDIVGGYEPLTKTMATTTIKSLILQINGDIKTISYKTKE